MDVITHTEYKAAQADTKDARIAHLEEQVRSMQATIEELTKEKVQMAKRIKEH